MVSSRVSGLGSGLGLLVLAFGFVLFGRGIGGLVRSRLVSFVVCLAVVVVVPFLVSSGLVSSRRVVPYMYPLLRCLLLSCLVMVLSVGFRRGERKGDNGR